MEHASLVQQRFDQLSVKYIEATDERDKAVQENIFYRRKEKEYNTALADKLEMQLEIDDYIAKTSKLNNKNRDLETKFKIATADNA